MINAFAHFWNLCIFRGSPVHVPSDNNAIAVLVLLIIGLSFLEALMLAGSGMWTFFAATMIVNVVVLSAFFFALQLRGVAVRFRKTLASYLGTLAITKALTTLVIWLSADNEVSGFLVAGFSIWRFAVTGFILKHSLEISLLVGTLIAFACFVFGSLVVVVIFPSIFAPVAQ
ncbi:MAG: hypothetical protein OXG24_02850 [Gammaproteobacteria bacterium]|nr:hypothetical protein [Gammaproteobacteria bacterium]